MTYDTFLTTIQQIVPEWDEYDIKSGLQMEHIKTIGFRNFETVKKPRLFVQWETGGFEGGNCWGDEAQEYDLNVKEKDLDALDIILEHFYPAMTFLAYKKLVIQLEKHNNYENWEYYGNGSRGFNKSIDIEELYDYLKEKEVFESE